MKIKPPIYTAFLISIISAFSGKTAADITSNHYDNNNKVFFSPGLIRGDKGQSKERPGLIENVKIFWNLTFSNSENSPPNKLPTEYPQWKVFLRDDGTDRFIWFGHSTIMIHLNKQTVMIDPVFGAASPFSWLFPRWQPTPARREELPNVNTILISHNHFDHFEEETARFYSRKMTHYVVPLGLGKQLKDWGIPASHITELDWYQKWESKGISYTAVPAQHISGRGLWDTNKTLWAGWVINTAGKRYFYSGDTGYSDHFSRIRRRFGPFNLAFIENGQYDKKWPDDHMSPPQTVQAAVDLGITSFVPVHWGAYAMAFHKWNDQVIESSAQAKQRHIREIIPLMGEVFTASTNESHWWESSYSVNER